LVQRGAPPLWDRIAHAIDGSSRPGAGIACRQVVLDAAYLAHPERFVRSAPKLLAIPKEVWINKPTENKTQ
jgi:hypothetical protein